MQEELGEVNERYDELAKDRHEVGRQGLRGGGLGGRLPGHRVEI